MDGSASIILIVPSWLHSYVNISELIIFPLTGLIGKDYGFVEITGSSSQSPFVVGTIDPMLFPYEKQITHTKVTW